MNKNIMNALFPEKVKLIDEGKCPFCEKPIDPNKLDTPLKEKEFKISGICGHCQDDFFK